MMESRYVTDCDCYLPEIEPLEGASVPSQADIFGVSGTVAGRPGGAQPANQLWRCPPCSRT